MTEFTWTKEKGSDVWKAETDVGEFAIEYLCYHHRIYTGMFGILVTLNGETVHLYSTFNDPRTLTVPPQAAIDYAQSYYDYKQRRKS